MSAVVVGVLVFACGSALATEPEAPETGAASAVTARTAKLGGVLNPREAGTAGVYYFVYAPRGAACNEYGASAEAITAGFEKEPVEPPVELAGLEPSTLYTFCLVDRNEAGEATVGSPKTFTTLAAAPAVEDETSSGVNSTAATLEGQVNPNNQVTTCEVQYGNTTAYGTKAPCEPTASLEGFGDQRGALALTGLTPGTTYHFRIVAENAGKEKKEGADQTFTTVPMPNTDAVTNIAPTTATFNGHLTLNPVDTQYFFYYKVGTECTGEGATPQEDAGSGSGTLASPSVAVTSLRPDTQYAVCMVTTNAFGSEHGVPVTFTTPPTSPTVENESSEDSGEQVLLNAHIVPNGGSTTYQFEYGETSSYGASIPAVPGDVGSGNEAVAVPAAAPTGLKSSAIYHYRVVATNQYGTTDGSDQTLLTPPLVGPSNAPGPTGLPDGRVYEEVTPAYKNGNYYDLASEFTFGLASAGGNAVLYPMSGAVGSAYAGTAGEYVSRRTPGFGWQTASATPRPTSKNINIFSAPIAIVPSADFDRFLFTSQTAYSNAEPNNESGILSNSSVNIYLSEDPAHEPTWLGNAQLVEPLPAEGNVPLNSYAVAGASADLKTVYFTYGGTLLPQDASRAPHVDVERPTLSPWGFYEWQDGHLESAGVLPNGTLNPFGAVPVAIAGRGGNRTWVQAQTLANEVSEDGTRAFFVSPDPQGGSPEPPELYVREAVAGGEHISVLISASELSGHEGEAATHGVESVRFMLPKEASAVSYAFASQDGSHVFFVSKDRLTQTAPVEGGTYVYDIDANSLTYTDITGTIVAVSHNGSEALFDDGTRLNLWRTGANGGSVTPITELPIGQNLNEVHISDDGSVLVFRTNAALPGGFNNGGGFEQIYRYEVVAGTLDCVSCAPAGEVSSGDARMSYNNYEENVKPNGYNGDPESTIETRGMSADGSRIFFDTPAALVPQDTNGTRDVYEWEDGTVHLISSGASSEESQVLDNSESGGDVFFATSQGLVPGDRDETYDVYDARIPRPGDNPAPSAVPCQGSVCQGPPSVPDLLGLPSSATFSGADSASPEPAARGSASKSLTTAQRLAAALKNCKRQPKKRRAKCEARARKKYGSRTTAKSHKGAK
ncbi:MAG TPA: hypothetical protein VK730_13390 [Solirubrobacteraceae bacterium]|nr:hypothetical protein [Solirubrobacteraceae bacterium]